MITNYAIEDATEYSVAIPYKTRVELNISDEEYLIFLKVTKKLEESGCQQ